MLFLYSELRSGECKIVNSRSVDLINDKLLIVKTNLLVFPYKRQTFIRKTDLFVFPYKIKRQTFVSFLIPRTFVGYILRT